MQSVKIKIASVIKRCFAKNTPNLLIVGAQKAGTTSLFHYLNQHPSFFGAPQKEVRFFDRDENYSKGIKWYKAHFTDIWNPLHNYKVYFEATPEYLYRLKAPERVYDFNQNMKIIILLRNPTKRAYSAWNMYRDFQISRKNLPKVFKTGYLEGKENQILLQLYANNSFPDFEQVVKDDIDKYNQNSQFEEPSFVRRGIYYPQVKKYFDLFGIENVKVIGFKELTGLNKVGVLNDILGFLEEEEFDWSSLEDNRRNARKYTNPIKESTQKQLDEFYSKHNEELFQLLGRELNW